MKKGGLRSSPNIKLLKNIFSPYKLDDLEEILDWMRNVTEDPASSSSSSSSSSTLSVILCGFSLGAISLGKYMTSKGDQIDAVVKGNNFFFSSNLWEQLLVPFFCFKKRKK